VDFWTFVFQAVNFFVLVALLYWLLYKPVRRTMQQREDQIKERYEAAERKSQDADKARKQAEAKQHEIDEKRQQLLNEANQAAQERREAMVNDAKAEADRLVQRTRDAVRREWTQAADALGETLSRTVLTLCAKVLEATGDSLTERAAREVIERIDAFDGADLEEAKRGAKTDRVTVRVAGPFSDKAKQQLSKAIGKKLGADAVELDVQEDASLVAGIEVALGTLRIRSHWRHRLDEALTAARQTIAESAPPTGQDEKPDEAGEAEAGAETEAKQKNPDETDEQHD